MRTSGKSIGCPFCSNRRVLVGYNDLKTTNPELVKEWNYEKNGNNLPEMYTCGSSKKVWWKCHTCGNEWQQKISYRVSGGRCRNCYYSKNYSKKDG